MQCSFDGTQQLSNWPRVTGLMGGGRQDPRWGVGAPCTLSCPHNLGLVPTSPQLHWLWAGFKEILVVQGTDWLLLVSGAQIKPKVGARRRCWGTECLHKRCRWWGWSLNPRQEALGGWGEGDIAADE